MQVGSLALIAAAVCGASAAITGWFRRYAVRRGQLDVPNPRSSHHIATPRGGGIAIVLSFLVALPILGFLDVVRWVDIWALTGGGTTVALAGFIDDRRGLASLWRLGSHLFAAAWLIALLGGLPLIRIGSLPADLGTAGAILGIVYVVWFINLTNFMDGIDGMAGLEVVTVCAGGVVCSLASVPDATSWSAAVVLAAATLGFLFWNWPPAKVFMGDAGSGFLGFTLAAVSLVAGKESSDLIWSWLILLGVFVVDATVTVARRAARGERLDVAHRSHAYQHASRLLGSHQTVTVAVGVINVAWLLPIALFQSQGRISGLAALLIGYAPLVVAALRLNAGKPVQAER
jgi:Fuc2NAc and GlcNAc transferase